MYVMSPLIMWSSLFLPGTPPPAFLPLDDLCHVSLRHILLPRGPPDSLSSLRTPGGGGGGDAKGVDLLSVIVVDNQMLVNRRKNCYVRRGYGLKKMSEGYEGSKEEI
jgi:hypothetical protein